MGASFSNQHFAHPSRKSSNFKRFQMVSVLRNQQKSCGENRERLMFAAFKNLRKDKQEMQEATVSLA